MRVPRDLVKRRMNAFLEACRALGVKLTHQRIEIYRELASTEEHPDAITLHRRIRRRIPTISLDTVYRNLGLLEEHGLIAIVGMSHERLRFDANLEPHHHFACLKCGMMRDFVSDHSDTRAWPEEIRAFGEPVSLHLEVRGICKNCRR